MSDKTNPGTEKDDKSDLDLIEEALVGSHQDVRADAEDEGAGGSKDPGPPVPGHRSP